METKYLDSYLSAYRLLDEKGTLPDNGKDQLRELEAIKQALNIDLVVWQSEQFFAFLKWYFPEYPQDDLKAEFDYFKKNRSK